MRPQSHLDDEQLTKGPTAGAVFRTGVVAELRPADARVRVRFPDRDNLLSWYLPVLSAKTQNDKFFRMPDLGEQVVCFMDALDEDGVVIGAIYSSVDTVPSVVTPGDENDVDHVTYADGTVIEYDRAAHVATVNIPAPLAGTVNVTVPGGIVTVVVQEGDVNVVVEGGSVHVKADHAYIESDDVKLGDTPINTVMLDTIIAKFNAHVHAGVTSGSNNSGVPQVPNTFILGTDSAPHVKAK